MTSKLVFKKFITETTRTYASQIYGPAKETHMRKLKSFQAKTFRTITKAPWYESNTTLHKDQRQKISQQPTGTY